MGLAVLTGADLIDASANSTVRMHQKQTLVGTVKNATSPATGKIIEVDLAAYVPTSSADGELYTDDIFGFIVDENDDILSRLKKGEVANNKVTWTYTGSKSANDTENVLVDYYLTVKSAKGHEIVITADKFAGYYYIEGKTLFRRQSDGVDMATQMVIPNAKIQTNFTFSMSPEGDPSTFTFTADAFPGIIKGSSTTSKKVLYALQMLDDEIAMGPATVGSFYTPPGNTDDE